MPASSSAALPSSVAKTILLAEDNYLSQKIVAMLFQKQGWSVKIAQDGAEALELLDQGGIAAVLLDCQMPGMDGYETTMAIRKKEILLGRKRIPIFAVTADAMEENRDRCMKAGMDGLFAKPFLSVDVANFLGMVQASIDKSHGNPG